MVGDIGDRLKKTDLNGCQGQRANHLRRFSGFDRRYGYKRRQFCDCLVGEDLLWGNTKSSSICTGHNLDAQDRIATDVKKIVARPDSLSSQHLSKYTCQHLFYFRTRCNIATTIDIDPGRGRQRLMIELS